MLVCDYKSESPPDPFDVDPNSQVAESLRGSFVCIIDCGVGDKVNLALAAGGLTAVKIDGRSPAMDEAGVTEKSSALGCLLLVICGLSALALGDGIGVIGVSIFSRGVPMMG
mmetsp:Transcript_13651/g.20547  ORF Transcript_13651/g.20547 Transcript_13651/m.20547 type:complete len:112 (-) Transcript_13651:1061-1396(-)